MKRGFEEAEAEEAEHAVEDISVDATTDASTPAETQLGTEGYRQRVARIFREVNRRSALLFGVDRDLSDDAGLRIGSGRGLGTKRAHRAAPELPPLGSELLARSRAARVADRARATWSLGYGEITAGAFDKVLFFMTRENLGPLRMGPGARFLDIGSGYGKVVLQARVAVPGLESCVGIECLPIRCDTARDVARKLEKAGVVDRGAAVFQQRDAARMRFFKATHVFCFDYVFSDETHEGIVSALERSKDVQLLVMFIPLSKLHAFGGKSYRLLHKFSATTTGQQHPTGYVFARAEKIAALGMTEVL